MVDITQSLLVVVDAQKDFMNEDGALYVEGAEAIKGEMKNVFDTYNISNRPVIYTQDWHIKSDDEIDDEDPDFVNTFPMHCKRWRDGAKIIDEVRPESLSRIEHKVIMSNILDYKIDQNKHVSLTKNKFNLFEGSAYGELLIDKINRNDEIKTIDVMGVSGNVCVKEFVQGAFHRTDKVIRVWKDAIESIPNDQLPNENDLLEKWNRTGIEILEG